jgi:hypothetical protein
MSADFIRPAVGFDKRGLRMTAEHTLIINHHGSSADLYEIMPTVIPGGIGPALVFYNIAAGRGEGERRHLMTLSVGGARWLFKYLPMLINFAERKARQQS